MPRKPRAPTHRRKARSDAQFLPLGIGAEGLPHFIAARQIFVGKHVGQVGLARADDGFAEEDRLRAGALEGADFAIVEHLDLALQRAAVVGFVLAEFEQARGALAIVGRRHHVRESIEGACPSFK